MGLQNGVQGLEKLRLFSQLNRKGNAYLEVVSKSSIWLAQGSRKRKVKAPGVETVATDEFTEAHSRKNDTILRIDFGMSVGSRFSNDQMLERAE